jgi:hypothetical protein
MWSAVATVLLVSATSLSGVTLADVPTSARACDDLFPACALGADSMLQSCDGATNASGACEQQARALLDRCLNAVAECPELVRRTVRLSTSERWRPAGSEKTPDSGTEETVCRYFCSSDGHPGTDTGETAEPMGAGEFEGSDVLDSPRACRTIAGDCPALFRTRPGVPCLCLSPWGPMLGRTVYVVE